MLKSKKNLWIILLMVTILAMPLGIPVNAAGITVTWKCSTASGLWQDKPSLTTTNWDNDTTLYVSVDPKIIYQQIDAWGGCFNERGWDAMSVLTQNNRDSIMRALFDPNTGLKLNICRTPIGASDYAITLYSLNETAGDYAMNNFSISRDTQMLIPYIQAAIAIRPDLKLWAVPWSPPSWMKTNNSLIGGNIKTDSQTMNALALYFEKYVQAYRAQGINLFMVMPQNEPTISSNYTSCLWTGEQLRDFIKNYLGPKFINDNLNCEIWLGTFTDSNYALVSPTVNDATALSYIKGAGFQWYGNNAAATLHTDHPELNLMQSETICGNHENDWPYAESQYALMKTYFEAGVNSYMLWNMVLDQTGLSTGGWAQCSPVTVNKNTKVITYNPQYYTFKHFSYFVDPGAFRVSYSGNYGDKIAFRNPNGDIVLVMQNTSGSNLATAINFDGQKIKPTLPAHSFNTFVFPASSTPRNAIVTIEAESLNTQSGTIAQTCSDTGGGQNIGFIENGDYAVYNNVDFGSGVNGFQARVASAASGGNIEIRLDSLTGTLIGTCPVAGTGGWQTWVTRTCNFSSTSSVHNIYLKFTGGGGYLFNLNWFKFNPTSGSTPTSTPTPMSTPSPTPAPTSGIVSGAYYKLVNVNSNKVIGINGMSTADGARAVQWSDNGTADHNWRLDLQANGYYKITNQNSGKVLGVDGMSTADGAQVLQWSDNGTADHDWQFTNMGGGRYKIINRNSLKCMGVYGASTADGANIVQWTDNGSNDQRWTLVKL